jgi:hypothetical protein
MGHMGFNIGNSIKVILAVLGIISAYPDVRIDNLFVYKDFTDKSQVKSQFNASDLINSSVRDIIESGIDVNIIYQITTSVKKHTIYQGAYTNRISYREKRYHVNYTGNYSFDILTNSIAVNELVILTNAGKYWKDLIQTDIEVLINCDATPEMINLWGNKPKVTITYNLVDTNED